jgi:hypothetical protein
LFCTDPSSGINCLREAGATAYSKHADRSPGSQRKGAQQTPLSRIGIFWFPGSASVFGPYGRRDARRRPTPKAEAEDSLWVNHRIVLRRSGLMPMNQSSREDSRIINALPRGALSPTGGRLSDGWRRRKQRAKNGLIGSD